MRTLGKVKTAVKARIAFGAIPELIGAIIGVRLILAFLHLEIVVPALWRTHIDEISRHYPLNSAIFKTGGVLGKKMCAKLTLF